MSTQHLNLSQLRLLDEAIRRDSHFIARHPSTIFQCLWNSCWWYDCPDAASHYHVDSTDVADSREPEPPEMFRLMESWLIHKNTGAPRSRWLKWHLPPTISLGGPQFGVLQGQSYVRAIAISRDGEMIASAGEGVRLWSKSSLIELDWLARESEIWSVAFSPTQDQLSAGDTTGDIRIWDTSSFRELGSLRGHQSLIRTLDYSADGEMLASCSGDGTLRIWDLSDCREVAKLSAGEDVLMGAAFMPFPSEVLYLDIDGYVKRWVWMFANQQTTIWKAAVGIAVDLAVSPTGKQFAVAGTLARDQQFPPFSLQVCSLDPRVLVPLTGHTNDIEAVAYSKDGSRIISGSKDGSLLLWETPAHATIRVKKEDGAIIHLMGEPRLTPLTSFKHGGGVSDVAFEPAANWCVSAGANATIRIWDLNARKSRRRLGGHLNADIHSIDFSAGGELIATAAGLHDSDICVWDAWTSKVLRRIMVKRFAWHVAFHPSDNLLAYTDSGAGIVFCDGESGLQTGMINQPNTSEAFRIAFSPDGGKLAATLLSDGQEYVVVFDLSTRREITRFATGHQKIQTICLAFGPDGKDIAIAGGDKLVRIWDLQTRSEAARFSAHTDTVIAVAFSGDGARVVSQGAPIDDQIRVWDVNTQTCVEVIEGCGDVRAVAAGLRLMHWAFIREGNIEVCNSGTRKTICHAPEPCTLLRQHPSQSMWAGAAGGELFTFSLR